MKLERQVVFWIAVLAAFIAFVWLLSGVLLPFIAGMALAYLLDPLARRIERLGVNRVVAIFLMMLAFVLGVIVLALAVVPVLAGQFLSLIENLPNYIQRLQSLVADPGRPWVSKLVGAVPDFQAGALMKDASGALLIFLRSLWSGGQAIVSLVSLVVITPVVAFYLLYDWGGVVRTIDRWLPRDHADTIRALARDMDKAIAGYVRGQVSICLILGALYIVGFSFVGLHYSFLIGVLAGIGSFIPYVGSFTAFLVATSIAIAQFWPEYMPVLAVIAVCLVCQFLEGYVLSPYLVGSSVGLHPVWLMFALLTFSYLFGFVGLLVAIPVAAAIGVLARFALRQYLASPMYIGRGPA